MNINLNKKGFTLIELIVVITIIGILSSLSFMAFFNKKTELKKEAIALYNNLQYAKIYAIKNRQNVTVTFYPDNNYYVIQFSDNNSRRYDLGDNVEFGDGNGHTVSFDNTNPPKETFTPLGISKYAGSIYLKLKNSVNYLFIISVNLNGRIIIQD